MTSISGHQARRHGFGRRRLLPALLAALSVAGPLRATAQSQPATNAAGATPASAHSNTNVLPALPPSTNPPSRYLFIVSTSAEMHRRAAGVQKQISNLVLSSMHAQLQGGESIGLWTFDENLYAGRFPLQRWTPELSSHVASNFVGFLRAQKYTGAGRFDRVWPTLLQVVRQSERLTVLIVSDGSEKISGTPYDREINGFLKQEFAKQRKAGEPFITVLRSQRGAFVGCSLNGAPWPVEFPEFPPLPVIVEAPKPKPPTPPPPPPKKETRPVASRLIVIGEDPETNRPPLTTPAPAISVPTVATNVPSPVKTEPPSAAAATPTTAPANLAVGAQSITPEPTVIPQPTPATAQPVKSEPVVPPTARPTEAVPEAVTPTPVAQARSEPPAVNPPAAAAKPVEAVPPATAPGMVVTAATPPAAAARIEAEHPVKPETKASEAAAPSTAPPAQAATAAPPEPGGWPLGIIAVGGGGVVLAGALVFLLLRRSRAAPHASLITRSMDKGEK